MGTTTFTEPAPVAAIRTLIVRRNQANEAYLQAAEEVRQAVLVALNDGTTCQGLARELHVNESTVRRLAGKTARRRKAWERLGPNLGDITE